MPAADVFRLLPMWLVFGAKQRQMLQTHSGAIVFLKIRLCLMFPTQNS